MEGRLRLRLEEPPTGILVRKRRGWYWKAHGKEYERFKVGELPKFCGWDVLQRLIKECENTPYFRRSHLFKLTEAEKEALRRKLIMRDKALIATAFETGGRISEVLALKPSNFEVKDDRIVVRDMPVVKRYEKVGERIQKWEGEKDPEDTNLWHWSHKYDAWIRRRFITKPKMDRRNVLEIPRFESLTQYIIQWLEELPRDAAWMFPGYGKDSNGRITATRSYQIVTSVGRRCGIVLCNHWFRSMRASQLAEEYGWREYELVKFFSWQSDRYARLYSKLSPARLFETMKPVQKVA
jgi:integrase